MRILPPALFLLCIMLMVTLRYFAIGKIIISFPLNLLGIPLIILCIRILVQVNQKLKKMNTEIHTFKKPNRLVTNGLFKYTRNPIYLSFLIGLTGVFAVLGNFTSLVVIIIFFIYTNYWYITFEEKQLEREFGEQYNNYKKNVRRWI